MSSLHQGILRAVRLLPDVVKIGVEAETALSSDQKGEQLLSDDILPEAAGPKKEVKQSQKKTNQTQQTQQPHVTEPLKELQSLIAKLEVQLNESKAKERDFTGKISSLEAELSAVRSKSAQKEREMAEGIDAAKEQARAQGMDEGRAEGLQKGYDEGLTKAKAETEAQYSEKFSSLAAMLEGVSAKLEEQFAELTALNQPRMLRLWQTMLKKMLTREMTITPDGIFSVLSDVLSRVSDKNHVLIYVSPDDIALLEDRLEGEFGEILRGVKHLELKPDAHVDKGSCIVETNLGVYDARWRTQFEQIDTVFESLFQQLGKPPQPKEKESSAKESYAKESRASAKRGGARPNKRKAEAAAG